MTPVPRFHILRIPGVFCRLMLCSALFLVPLLFQTTRFEYNHQVYDIPKQTAWVVLLAAFIWGSFLLGRRGERRAPLLLSLLLLGIWVACLRAVNVGMALAGGLVASLPIVMSLLASRSFG